MTSDGEAAASGTVTALRRPPVRQSIVVRSGRRRWEQLAKDCALPGGYLGGAYREGWGRILGCLAAMTGGPS